MVSDVYRSAASAVVFRPSGNVAEPYAVLLLHKPRKRDAWQLPQGGSEGDETTEQTALRELFEEAGLRDTTVLGWSDEVYQYDFPASFRRFRPDNVRGQRIQFVFVSAKSDADVRVDQKEVDGFAWVLPSHIPEYIHRKAYVLLVLRLIAAGVPLMRALTA